jgi:hypothetical protein
VNKRRRRKRKEEEESFEHESKRKTPKTETKNQDGNNMSRKMSHRKKEDCVKKLRRKSCGKEELDGEALLSDDPHKVGTS